ncbi:MAG: hypothetical protein M1161_00580 [Candidatus Thermoplasmatota archaeon]|jgi:hypothetical protein|nr:hypothetical protein [Candidatus Thermoplasmatota archaeon]
MNLSRDISKTWPNFNEGTSKGEDYQGGRPESLKRVNSEFVEVEDFSDLFIQVFHYEIIDSRSTIFKDGSQEPYPGRSDKK